MERHPNFMECRNQYHQNNQTNKQKFLIAKDISETLQGAYYCFFCSGYDVKLPSIFTAIDLYHFQPCSETFL